MTKNTTLPDQQTHHVHAKDAYHLWQRDPLSEVWPNLPEYEFTVLRESLAYLGQQEPIIVCEGGSEGHLSVLDGWHRMKAIIANWQAAIDEQSGKFHIAYKILPADHDPTEFVIAANRARRQLSKGQTAAVLAELESLEQGRPKKGQKCGFSAQELAKSAGVSTRLVEHARAVRKGSDPLYEAIKAGILSPKDAQTVLDQPEEDHPRLVDMVRDRQAETAFLASQKLRRARTAAQVPVIEWPTGEYTTLVVDPPWPIDQVPYPTMTVDQIRTLELPAAHAAVLWLWATHRFLEQALQTVGHWGFELEAVLTWCKPGGRQPTGMPQLASEFVILALRGEQQINLAHHIGTWFEAPRGEHSAKPDKFYDIVRRTSPEPRIDMFNRRPLEGFTVWGAEA